MYLDNTALKGAAVINAKIKMYNTVPEYNSRDAYPSFDAPSKASISIIAAITTNIGNTVITVLYPAPINVVRIVFLLYMSFLSAILLSKGVI